MTIKRRFKEEDGSYTEWETVDTNEAINILREFYGYNIMMNKNKVFNTGFSEYKTEGN